MFDDDPFAPQLKKPRPMELMSIDELEARIAALNEEIALCRRAIEAKEAQRNVAESLFTNRGAGAASREPR